MLFDNLFMVVRFIFFSFFFDILLCDILNKRCNLFLCFVFFSYVGGFIGMRGKGVGLVIRYWKDLILLLFFVCIDNKKLFGVMVYVFLRNLNILLFCLLIFLVV